MSRGLSGIRARLVRLARVAIQTPLLPLERVLLLRGDRAPASPPLFIIGLPRSGTTLVYQLLVTSLRLAFLSNIANTFHLAPALCTRLSVRQASAYASQFESDYGRTSGWMAPNEGGLFWNRWFEPARTGSDYIDEDSLRGRGLETLRRTVAQLESSYRGPFVNKNVYSSVRIRALDAAFPNAIFLRVQRDPIDVAASILQARRTVLGSSEAWWSVRPRRYEELCDESPLSQIAGQVWGTEEDIDNALMRVDAARRMTMAYEDVCASPSRLVDKVREVYSLFGVNLANRYPVPDAFEPSRSSMRLAAREVRALRDALEEQEPGGGRKSCEQDTY